MKHDHNARHEALWGLDQGMPEPYSGFSPLERTIVDFRLGLPQTDKTHLNVQYGLPGITPDIVSSPYAQEKARLQDVEKLEAVRMEIDRSIRI